MSTHPAQPCPYTDNNSTHLPRRSSSPTQTPSTSSSHWGDPITPPNHHTLRIVFQNAHTLHSDSWQHLPSIFESTNKLCANIIGLAETNTRWSPTTTTIVKNIARRHFTHPRISYSNSSDLIRSSIHQPGGTLLLTHDKYSGRVQHSGQDPSGMGRWSTLRLEGTASTIVNIVCAYRVC